jgi:hypothetical protein
MSVPAYKQLLAAMDMRAYARMPNPLLLDPSSMIPPKAAKEPVPKVGNGWQEPNPLSPPPGVALVDRLCDAADAADRLELKRRLAP